MKILVVEDDFTSRILLQRYLSSYGDCHIAINGKEAVDAFKESLKEKQPYDLICMDIIMPEMSGQEALKKIRDMEKSSGILSSDGVKIIMVTAVEDVKNIFTAFNELCDTYLVKPIDKKRLEDQLRNMKLI
jgi:two-component system chemotaxis response regulator CheY